MELAVCTSIVAFSWDTDSFRNSAHLGFAHLFKKTKKKQTLTLNEGSLKAVLWYSNLLTRQNVSRFVSNKKKGKILL